MKLRWKAAAYVIGLLLFVEVKLRAQFPTKPGTTELSVYTGGSFDFPGATAAAGGFSFATTGASGPAGLPKLTPGRKSQPILGGEVGVAIRKYLWVFGDYGYLFPDSEQATASIPVYSRSGNNTITNSFTYTTGIL